MKVLRNTQCFFNADLEFAKSKPATRTATAYGLPYTGSKRMIAYDIVNLIKKRHPNARWFIDLFGGGGTMSLMALQFGYKNIVYNELNKGVFSLFQTLTDGSLQGGKCGPLPDDWYNWITREQFKQIVTKQSQDAKSTMIRLCWSFGNSGSTYIYGSEIEEYKLAFYNVVMHKDKLALKFMENFLEVKDLPMPTSLDWRERRLQLRQALPRVIRKFHEIEIPQVCNTDRSHDLDHGYIKLRGARICETSFKNNQGLQNIEQLERVYNITTCMDVEHFQRVQKLEKLRTMGIGHLIVLPTLQHLERVERLSMCNIITCKSFERVQRCENVCNNSVKTGIINYFNLDYKEFARQVLESGILPLDETVIYCDPPYEDTLKHNDSIYNPNAFNTSDLIEFVKACPYPVYVSGYKTFDGLQIVLQKKKPSLYACDPKAKSIDNYATENLLWNGVM